jgi:two-component system chemotaxis response regulator CheY
MSKKILVIDDDKLIREGLVALLKNAGQTVLEAGDGAEGLEKALSEKPDLVVTDVRMPKMTGLEMIEQLRVDAWGKNVPVIILTNDESNASINQALQSGVTTYFSKSLSPATLSQQVLQTIGE